ncbi:MAG TPA: hypothetical protein VMB72_02655, partial [Acidimicrobiales bacterium]|nr:hypothetical protein [Acidimicrobiales bacterium]
MTGRILGTVALVAVVAAGGSVWLVVRDERGRHRASSARVVRVLTGASAVVVAASLVVVRPWTWAAGLAAGVVGAAGAVHVLLRALERRPSPARGGDIVAALATVLVASALVIAGGFAVVIDGAALARGRPTPTDHGGAVLARPTLVQVFWGPAWAATPAPPALGLAARFQRDLPTSSWARAVEHAGFGVRGFADGGCWVDPAPPAASPRSPAVATGTGTGLVPAELRKVFSGRDRLRPCPGDTGGTVPAALPPDAVVALWLDPSVVYGLGGVSAHGTTPWPGRPYGVAVAGFTGGWARWGTPACATSPSCRSVPPYAAPTYALSHELVESATNPFGQGWFADPPLPWSARYVLD